MSSTATLQKIKGSVSRLLSRFLSPILKKTGLIALPISYGAELHSALEYFVDSRLVKVVYDVGSYNGTWAREVARKHFPRAEIYLFEANGIHFPYPSGLANGTFNILLSDKEGQRPFFSIGGTGDSIYRENSRFYEQVVPSEKKTQTLAGVITQKGLPKPDFLKIDVQGSELDILRGMNGILLHVRFILVELNLLDYNLGAPSASDVISFLSVMGFTPKSIPEMHHIDGILSQIDILFENKSLVY